MENLSNEELVFLIYEDDSSEDLLGRLIKNLTPMMVKIGKKHLSKLYLYDVDDYIQEGRIAVFKAMKSFDVNGASLFYTYVCLCINRCLITYCSSLGASKNSLLNNSLSDETYSFLGDIEYEPSIFVGNVYSDKAIIDYKNTLDFLDSTIFELRYNGFSYIEIGTLLDISSTTVARHLCKIKKTLQGIKDKF